MRTSNQAEDYEIRRGVYDSDYFSGAQVAIYIGDTWIDEITSLSFHVQEPRVPLYGYADTKFRDVCRGQVFVTGGFSINFKEAGYLWLVLNRYKKMVEGRTPPIEMVDITKGTTKQQVEMAKAFNIEETYVQNKLNAKKKSEYNNAFAALAENRARLLQQKVLTGYSNSARGLGNAGTEMMGAESIFEAFENVVWGHGGNTGDFNSGIRRVTEKSLNPFDIYITYGDYTGDDRLHHTVQKLETVYLTSVGKRMVIDGTPIQEEYTFIARDLV